MFIFSGNWRLDLSFKKNGLDVIGLSTFFLNQYFLLFKKKYPVDFDDKLKVGDVRYKHLTQITIKV